MSRPLSTALAGFGAGIGRSLAIITPGSHKGPAGDTRPLAVKPWNVSPSTMQPMARATQRYCTESGCQSMCLPVLQLLVERLKRRRCTGVTCQTACGCAVSSSCTRQVTWSSGKWYQSGAESNRQLPSGSPLTLPGTRAAPRLRHLPERGTHLWASARGRQCWGAMSHQPAAHGQAS